MKNIIEYKTIDNSIVQAATKENKINDLLCEFLNFDSQFVISKELFNLFVGKWNIGYSPKGKNHIYEKFSFGLISFDFDVVNGYIEKMQISGDFFTKKDVNEFAERLNGKAWEKNTLIKVFSDVGEYILNANGEEIVNKLF